MWRFLFLLFLTSTALAAETGEITEVSRDGVIRFFLGDVVVLTGERLRVLDSHGQSDRFVEVTKVDPPYAEAKFDSMVIHPYETFEPLKPGQRVKLTVEQTDLKAGSFFVGANTAPHTGAFGGTNWFLGISVRGYLAKHCLWQVNLQADSFGKDAAGTEVRRSSYLVGAGYEWMSFDLFAHIGLIDTMTIVKNTGAVPSVDPFTGVNYGANTTTHETKAGFMLELARPFMLSPVSRTSKIGWSVSPRVSYGNTFSRSPYHGIFSYGAGVDLWFD